MNNLEDAIRARAHALGFDVCRVSSVEPFLEDRQAMLARLAAGQMDGYVWYTAERVLLATEPARLLPTARSLLSLASSYLAGAPLDRTRPGEPHGRIAGYAWGRDYHQVLRSRAEQLVEAIAEILGRPPGACICVDSSPLADRAVARRAGTGWFGKNTNVLIPGVGSHAFLVAILLDLALEPDGPLRKTCGACARCLPACPTGALVEPYVLDNRCCISYLTIERRGPMPRALRPLVGNWIFGCDLCQDACPVNRHAAPTRVPEFHPADPDAASPALLPLLALDEEGFRRRFAGTSVLRARRWGLQRNTAIALGNVADPVATPALQETTRAHDHPIVRGHAAWALGRIAQGLAREELQPVLAFLGQARDAEQDDGVREELALAAADCVRR